MENFNDFNDAPTQAGDAIPAGTYAKLVMTINPGNVGEGGLLTQSKSSSAQYLNCEFIVSAGPYAMRRVWQNMILTGGSVDAQGKSVAGNISRQNLRAILESARGVIPTDYSETAQAKRRINGIGDFNGMEFAARIHIEIDGTSEFKPKNFLGLIITPDMPQYQAIMNGENIPAEDEVKCTKYRKGTAPGKSVGQQAPAWAPAGAPAQTARPGVTPAAAAPAWAQKAPAAPTAPPAAPQAAPQTQVTWAPAQAPAPAPAPGVPTWAQ